MNNPKLVKPAIEAAHKLRFVTATSLFDGHDVSINIMRRILQGLGVEVIHLGHNRSVQEIVTAALQEDAQGVAVTSYQGGHIEFFKYLVDLLRENGGSDIKVFGGGGGTIIPAEIKELMDYGVTRIYSPEDGAKMGLKGMIEDVVALADHDPCANAPKASEVLEVLKSGDRRALARVITALEAGAYPEKTRKSLIEAAADIETPVLGITGTGGAGKSSLTDELIMRLRLDYDDKLKLGDLSIDPSRKRTGGALLGDRIRMNAIDTPNVYFRSLATRQTAGELSSALPEAIAACKLSGFDLLLVETSGIGQGDAAIVPFVDLSMYVMTPEFGAASQLEKIDMLDFADFVAINKFDRKGAADAQRDVAKQYQRNRELFSKRPDEMPVFGTIASHFHDDGVTALYQALRDALIERGLPKSAGRVKPVNVKASTLSRAVVPPDRARYLAEISETVRGYHDAVLKQARVARELQALKTTQTLLERAGKPVTDLAALEKGKHDELLPAARKLLEMWPKTRELYGRDEYVVHIRDKEIRTQLATESLSGTRISKVSLPKFEDDGETLRFLMKENLPGAFPFTGGVFAFKREGEDPTRMFAGEGDAFRTNRRFKKVSEGMKAKRLSTAFDSVTLYGWDPDKRPDIYGKVGNSGVSICTLDDMKALYDGFDLCSPTTSVSMTINGPAPTILAMFMNTAVDQQIDKFRKENSREPTDDEVQKIRDWALSVVRGTVQADILKEDQGQNTCIFSTEFSLRAMGDIQEYFVHHKVRNFYSVSISGYHIAEAGANPISQLAFTLANGFTFVEAYLARGMHIDDFAPNLSFFFSNGMDPEYSVIGRVARRIWAVAMRDKYGASERSQKLKYHVQTSGRSLHAQEMAFNDIRTTLEALIAIYDNCNSLHTNAYDEAVTTPTEESVRRAMAIQLIINHEWGLAKNQNPLQGSFIIDELTDLVEEAVLKEFDAISARGGVLGAMETAYQRGQIQEESLYYESKKNDGSLPIMGVNTFRNPHGDDIPEKMELARSTEEEKQSQLKRLAEFQEQHAAAVPAMQERLRDVAMSSGNIFAVLMDAVRVMSLGQITQTLFQVGGRYRRNM
ncbi:MAG TPA: fused isobutyryl-CoA mutase/GTPase IcmF [Nevskiaceae bacterium]|nr:fused isobutyryl-CoA mutase/GTPase IcmF [Nevskiaceae bacterium]